MAPLEAYVPFFAAFWFFLSAGYFLYRLRTLPGNASGMYPIAVYLVGIGLFFVFRGYSTFATTSCPTIDCTQTSGGLAVMLASSFIARFPLQEEWPGYERLAFWALVAVSVVATAVTAVYAPTVQVPLAHAFAFVVAGLFSVGYIGYAAIEDDSTTGKGIGLSMSSCCLVAHGLAVLPLVATVSVPLIGVPLGLPVLFAILAPVSLLGVLVFFARIDPDSDVELESDVAS